MVISPTIICYLICLLISFFILIHVYTDNLCGKPVLMEALTLVVGNAGYLALALADNLNEAILAIKITYILGLFSPLLSFLIVCEICHLKFPKWLIRILNLIQVSIYFFVFSINYSDLFYKSAQFHKENGIVYVTKEYGPVHSLYFITLVLYLVAAIVVAAISVRKKNMINPVDVDILLVTSCATGGCYILERTLGSKIELMPVVFTVSLIIYLCLYRKLHKFILSENAAFLNEKLEKSGYILVDKNLRFEGCNDFAKNLFPELGNWEIDKKIPGNGGRFNTYLRQPLMHYIEDDIGGVRYGKSFTIMDVEYLSRYNLYLNEVNKKIGYIIEIIDLGALKGNDFEKEN